MTTFQELMDKVIVTSEGTLPSAGDGIFSESESFTLKFVDDNGVSVDMTPGGALGSIIYVDANTVPSMIVHFLSSLLGRCTNYKNYSTKYPFDESKPELVVDVGRREEYVINTNGLPHSEAVDQLVNNFTQYNKDLFQHKVGREL